MLYRSIFLEKITYLLPYSFVVPRWESFHDCEPLYRIEVFERLRVKYPDCVRIKLESFKNTWFRSNAEKPVPQISEEVLATITKRSLAAIASNRQTRHWSTDEMPCQNKHYQVSDFVGDCERRSNAMCHSMLWDLSVWSNAWLLLGKSNVYTDCQYAVDNAGPGIAWRRRTRRIRNTVCDMYFLQMSPWVTA